MWHRSAGESKYNHLGKLVLKYEREGRVFESLG